MYQSNAPVLWCPECRTALAQADVEKKEFDSVFYDIEFNLVDGSPLIISTTRPELLPACTAVFINSKDKRYLDIL
ncbi:class I tRNA ligase family protein [bacterium]|nr:class I tRNA ligase family protein [bacterium]